MKADTKADLFKVLLGVRFTHRVLWELEHYTSERVSWSMCLRFYTWII